MLTPYLQLLALTARADGVIDPNERAAIQQASQQIGLKSEDLASVHGMFDLSRQVDLQQAAAAAIRELLENNSVVDGRAAAFGEVLRDCYVMAAIDGEVSAREVELIDQIMAAAGVVEGRRATLHQWADGAARSYLDGVALIAESFPAVGTTPAS
jgi:tellurite resistance protein